MNNICIAFNDPPSSETISLRRQLADMSNTLALYRKRDVLENKLVKKRTAKDVHDACVPIIQAVCEEFHFTITAMLSRCRENHFVEPRHIAMFLCREILDTVSLEQLAKVFRRKDHGTILHACNAIRNRCDVDKAFSKRVDSIRMKINEKGNPRG